MQFRTILASDARVDLAMRDGGVFRPKPCPDEVLPGEGGENALRRRLEMSLDDEIVGRSVTFLLSPWFGRILYVEKRFEPIEAALSEEPGVADPPLGLRQPVAAKGAHTPLRLDPPFNQLRFFEDPEMTRNGGAADVEGPREFADRRVPRRQPPHNGAAGRIGESRKGLAQKVHEKLINTVVK